MGGKERTVRIQNFFATVFCIGALAGLPAAAAVPQACIAGSPESFSYNRNYEKQANDLLQDIRSQASQAQRQAADLRTFARTGQENWQAHAFKLAKVKTEVNDMGRELCRLDVIRPVLEPWQQNAINRIAPHIQLIADNAQDAIGFLNTHETTTLWQPTYRLYVRNLDRQARQISHTVKNSQAYASAQTKRGALG
jgi:hypothetical protein